MSTAEGDRLSQCSILHQNPLVLTQRQLRCDVVQGPTYIPCERCRRLNLQCKIEQNFKRVGKRSKNAEMEREIVELRTKLASQNSSPTTPSIPTLISTSASPSISQLPSTLDQYMGSQEAVSTLMDLRSGLEGGSFMRSPNGQILPSRRLEDIVLTHDRVRDLFQQYVVLRLAITLLLTRIYSFFTLYHPFLPLLDPEKSPDDYYDSSTFLFWTIIIVAARRYSRDPLLLNALSGPVTRLLWTTIAEVPQNYIVVKALCIFCTWSLPISTSSSDFTFMLSGLMMQISLQIGLHRPSHAQDFTKFRIELREEELKDRVRTWAACNAVAQRCVKDFLT